MNINSAINSLESFHLAVDETGAKERAASIAGRSIKKQSKVRAIKLAVSMIDLTTLEGKDSDGKVHALCQKGIHPIEGSSEIPHVAAICVYPNMIRTAKSALAGSGVKVASVATGFPGGQVPMKLKIDEVKKVVSMGADEVDMVISRGQFLEGNYRYTFDEVTAVKEACGDAHLKVILETGELETFDNVRKASIISMLAGADFIKTSTGKVQPAATLPVTLVMLEAIRDFYNETGKITGMKPAGGIKTTKDAIAYLCLVNETLGDTWLTPDLFRMGASSLLNDLLMQYKKEQTGIYQSADYFSND
ncbi:MAG TPA: deoxyribose-phosphate aldolase [Ignavibacteria bacterium]|nr:deoxyribose-phosphate aldolase [Ignavibacteria bacterium]HMQ99577.1 deoxyribose-phosphate aldolase [Ignavibacteria bacterium]